jgi:hypothetical protein
VRQTITTLRQTEVRAGEAFADEGKRASLWNGRGPAASVYEEIEYRIANPQGERIDNREFRGEGEDKRGVWPPNGKI